MRDAVLNPGASARQEAVTILKPLHFDGPELFGALESFLAQDYGAPVQIVFGVQDADDPATACTRDNTPKLQGFGGSTGPLSGFFGIGGAFRRARHQLATE